MTAPPHKNNDAFRLIAIIFAHLMLCAVYAHYTPYGVPPDEGPHGLYVQSLAESHGLPVFDPNDRQNYEAHQPPFYYVMAVPFYMVGKAVALSDPAAMVRLLSAILGALSILVVYRAVRAAFPGEQHMGIAAAGFAALLPTHVMLSSSAGNDILVELVFGLTILPATRVLLDRPSPARTLGLGVMLGLGILTKTTCLILFPAVVLAYLLAWRRGRASGKAALGHLIGLLLVSLAVGGWWFVRNKILYGDPLAMAQFKQAFEHTARPEYWFSRGFTPAQYWILVAVWTFCSFWGVFGHMKVFLPVWTYLVLALMTLLAKIESLRGQWDLWRSSKQQQDVLLVYYAVLLLVFAAFVGFNISFFQAQGRYLYPAILPIAAFWSLAVRRMLPDRLSGWTPHVSMAVPLAAQIVALVTCIIPRMPHYQ